MFGSSAREKCGRLLNRPRSGLVVARTSPRKWAAEGHAVYLLDERSAPRGSDSIEKDALDDEDEDEYHEDRDRDP
jgi:hypothetical protein